VCMLHYCLVHLLPHKKLGARRLNFAHILSLVLLRSFM
jgi:hypothetical protein